MDDLSKRRSERIENLGSSSMSEEPIDLSNTGVCCIHSKSSEKGTVVTVEIKSIRIKARVAYCAAHGKEYRLGLQFIETTPQLQKQINAIVDGYSKGVPVDCRVVE